MARKLKLNKPNRLNYIIGFVFFLTQASCSMLEDPQPETDILGEISEAADFGDFSEGNFDDFDTDSGATNEVAEFDDFDFDDFSEESSAQVDDFAFDETEFNETEFDDFALDETEFDSFDEAPSDELFLAAEPSFSPPVEVTGINFNSNESGGLVEIQTSAPATYTTRYNADTYQFVVEIQNAQVRDSLKRPFIMKEFEGVFGAINAYQTPGVSTARVVVQMKGAGEPFVQQEGSKILVLPATGRVDLAQASEEPPADEKDAWKESYDTDKAEQERALGARTLDEFLTGSGRFYGRPISIQTNDADIRDIISFIADEAGINIVLAEDVQGRISLKLRQVPWDQALVIVMRSRGLGYTRQGNVIRVTQLATLQAEARSAKDIVDAQARLTPLKVKVIPVSYAAVNDLEEQVKPFLTADRGKVVHDLRTSSLIITDTAEVLSRVERLVKELDIPPAQVMIEGKIVEASEAFTKRLGVNWNFGGVPVEVSSGGGFQGSPISLNATYGAVSLNQDQLSAVNSVLSLSIGTLDFLGDLNATLGLAQSENMVRIVSSPRVVTMNKAEAEISQKGEVITINRQTQAGQENVTTESAERTPVELKLKVTPQITAEGSVMMDVEVLRQFPGAPVDTSTLARPINSREAKTRVLVPNGQTAVIGGIYQSDDTNTETGVPFLKDIPVLGWLFKSRSEERIKNELIIFLTPRVLNAKDQAVSSSELF